MKRVLIILMVAALATASQAAVVSYNFDNNGTVGNVDGTYNGDMVAGLVPVVGWHNDWWSYVNTDLYDNTGATTSIDISWESPAMYSVTGSHPGQDADGTWNKEMINGYLNAGVAEWTPIAQSSVTLSQIVAEGASYDIYVYFSSDAAGRTGTITDGTTTYYFNTLGGASIPAAPSNAVLIQATDTTDAGYGVAANYAVFSGLTGSTQTITCDIPDWGGIAAIQIDGVVPEPATMLLLGLGGLILRNKR